VLANSSTVSPREMFRSIARAPIAGAERATADDGFSLIELLVVVLIVGILAAIAIPSLLNETTKANDSAAKTQVGTLQTTMKLFAMENSGSYAGASLTKLQAIEPTLRDRTTAIAKEVVSPTTTGFTIESEAVGSGDVFKLESEDGAVTRSCSPRGKGGCPPSGTW
jgi:prepilin-type N-terminal cleavage/methylation domain-containing protein